MCAHWHMSTCVLTQTCLLYAPQATRSRSAATDLEPDAKSQKPKGRTRKPSSSRSSSSSSRKKADCTSGCGPATQQKGRKDVAHARTAFPLQAQPLSSPRAHLQPANRPIAPAAPPWCVGTEPEHAARGGACGPIRHVDRPVFLVECVCTQSQYAGAAGTLTRTAPDAGAATSSRKLGRDRGGTPQSGAGSAGEEDALFSQSQP